MKVAWSAQINHNVLERIAGSDPCCAIQCQKLIDECADNTEMLNIIQQACFHVSKPKLKSWTSHTITYFIKYCVNFQEIVVELHVYLKIILWYLFFHIY